MVSQVSSMASNQEHVIFSKHERIPAISQLLRQAVARSFCIERHRRRKSIRKFLPAILTLLSVTLLAGVVLARPIPLDIDTIKQLSDSRTSFMMTKMKMRDTNEMFSGSEQGRRMARALPFNITRDMGYDLDASLREYCSRAINGDLTNQEGTALLGLYLFAGFAPSSTAINTVELLKGDGMLSSDTAVAVGKYIDSNFGSGSQETVQKANSDDPGSREVPPMTRAEDKDKTAITSVVDNLYKFVVSADFAGRPDQIRQFLTPRLYVLLQADYEKSQRDQEEPSWSFIPGNGGADEFLIRDVQMATGTIATVSVAFSNVNQPIRPEWKVYLQLEKTNDGRWLVSNLSDVDDNGRPCGDIVSHLTAPISLTQPTQPPIPNAARQAASDLNADPVTALSNGLRANGKSCPGAFQTNGKDTRNGREFLSIQGGEDHPDRFVTTDWFCVDTSTGEVFREDMAESNLVSMGFTIDVGQSQQNSSSAAFAWVADKSGVTLRDAPSRSGKRLAVMPYGSELTVINNQGPSETIGGKAAHWVNVKYTDRGASKSGWCFAGFLTDQNPLSQGRGE